MFIYPVRSSCALLALFSLPTVAASIDGLWDCAQSETAGTIKIVTQLHQHYDTSSGVSQAKGQIELYQQGVLDAQFNLDITGTFSLDGSHLTEQASSVKVESTLPSTDANRAQQLSQQLEQAIKAGTDVDVLVLDAQQLQVKDRASGQVYSCQRASSAV